MNKSKGKDDFLKKPAYPGGDKALSEFVAKNVRYPEEAKAAKIEGKVLVAYDVTDNGEVINPHIINGIGYGCDEEALRLIGLLKFSKVKNRKIRVSVKKRTSIHFKLPQQKINYSLSSKKKPPASKEKTNQANNNSGYSYTINIPSRDG